MKVGTEGQPPSPAQLTFLAHVDATPHDLEVWETAEAESFEKSWQSRLAPSPGQATSPASWPST